MTIQELVRKRIERWRLRPDLAPNDEKEIRRFIKDVGFCYTFHIPKDTIPSLIQTIGGTQDVGNHFAEKPNNPYHQMLSETFAAYRKQKLFLEVGIFGKHPVTIYRDVFVRIYRVTGNHVRGGSPLRRKRNTKLEQLILEYLTEKETATRRDLRLSVLTKKQHDLNVLTRSLESLSKQLKIIRLRQSDNNELIWMRPEQWSPQLCRQASELSYDDAVEDLILRFLTTTIATSRRAVRKFFKHCIPPTLLDYRLDSLLQRGLILVDPELIIDGKKALKIR
jgi:hypothetical protein